MPVSLIKAGQGSFTLARFYCLADWDTTFGRIDNPIAVAAHRMGGEEQMVIGKPCCFKHT